MAARRLLLVMVLLLIASSLAAALVPPPPDEDSSSTTTTSTSTTVSGSQATGEAGHSRLISQSVDAEEKRPAQLLLKPGDQLALAVSSDRFVEVEVPEFGLVDTATQGSPARFNLLAAQPGRFGVRTLQPRRIVAQITVSEPER